MNASWSMSEPRQQYYRSRRWASMLTRFLGKDHRAATGKERAVLGNTGASGIYSLSVPTTADSLREYKYIVQVKPVAYGGSTATSYCSYCGDSLNLHSHSTRSTNDHIPANDSAHLTCCVEEQCHPSTVATITPISSQTAPQASETHPLPLPRLPKSRDPPPPSNRAFLYQLRAVIRHNEQARCASPAS